MRILPRLQKTTFRRSVAILLAALGTSMLFAAFR
jgi:hypothetical protein